MKTAFRRYFILLLPMAFLFVSCNDSANALAEEADATLYWSGEYMVDGCGFHLVINDTKYKPENEDAIGDAFKSEEPMQVTVKFERLEQQIDRPCGLSPQSRAMDGIRVIAISKKQ
ncbi:hypothetical protein ACMA1I_21865 [Pontibacter sp. 13R65]|uniref:hypothetical protein n=1 Tax=Pontibacter sp. 13R65 TaxID=3127458 RepID=UPI00301DDE90